MPKVADPASVVVPAVTSTAPMVPPEVAAKVVVPAEVKTAAVAVRLPSTFSVPLAPTTTPVSAVSVVPALTVTVLAFVWPIATTALLALAATVTTLAATSTVMSLVPAAWFGVPPTFQVAVLQSDAPPSQTDAREGCKTVRSTPLLTLLTQPAPPSTSLPSVKAFGKKRAEFVSRTRGITRPMGIAPAA